MHALTRRDGRRTACLSFAVALICAGVAAAQPATPAGGDLPEVERTGPGLAEVLRLAVERSPELRAAGLRIDASEAAVRSAEGAFDLTLTGRFDWSTSRRTGTGFDGAEQTFDTERMVISAGLVQPLVWGTRVGLEFVTDNTSTNNPFLNCIPGLDSPECFDTQVRLSVTQPLLQGAGREVTESQVELARQSVELSRVERRETAESRVEAVAVAWLELGYAAESLAIQQQALALAEEQLAATDARIEVGQLAPADRPVVAQAVAQRRRAILLAEQNLADQRDVVAAALAVPTIEPGPLDPPPPLAMSREEARSAAESASASLARSRIEEQQLETRLAVQDDAGLPRLDLTLIAAQSGIDDSFGGSLGNLPENDTHYYGAVLDFSWAPANNVAEGEVARLRATLEASRVAREATEIELHRQVDSAVRAVRLAEGQIELDRQSAELAAEALDAEKKKFDSGRATNLDVLQVQQDLATARLQVARTQTDRAIARTRLLRLTGGLLDAFGLSLAPR